VFEDDPPERWPAQSMAAVTTHDLPTVAGLWSGADLAEQLSFGSGAKQDLVKGAAELSSRLEPAGLDESASPEDAIGAAYQLLARSPAVLLAASLEDAVADQRRPNMPGVPERPNWCLPMPVPVEGLTGHPLAAAIARTLSAAIATHPGHASQGHPATNLATQGHPETNLSSQSSPDAPENQGHER